jgi:hypothetical protein
MFSGLALQWTGSRTVLVLVGEDGRILGKGHVLVLFLFLSGKMEESWGNFGERTGSRTVLVGVGEDGGILGKGQVLVLFLLVLGKMEESWGKRVFVWIMMWQWCDRSVGNRMVGSQCRQLNGGVAVSAME